MAIPAKEKINGNFKIRSGSEKPDGRSSLKLLQMPEEACLLG